MTPKVGMIYRADNRQLFRITFVAPGWFNCINVEGRAIQHIDIRLLNECTRIR